MCSANLRGSANLLAAGTPGSTPPSRTQMRQRRLCHASLPSDGRAPGTALGRPGRLACRSRQPPEARCAPAPGLRAHKLGVGAHPEQSDGLHLCYHGAAPSGQPPHGPTHSPTVPQRLGTGVHPPRGRRRRISLRSRLHPANNAPRGGRVPPGSTAPTVHAFARGGKPCMTRRIPVIFFHNILL
jgi:hypothetical protein